MANDDGVGIAANDAHGIFDRLALDRRRKLARVLGTNNVDLCSRMCHAATVSGLKVTLGVGAPTCSLSDFIGTELLVVFGSHLANNQPV